MKKILLGVAFVMILGGCNMYKIHSVHVMNASSYEATVLVKNFYENKSKIHESAIKIEPNKNIEMYLYNDGYIEISSIGRNYLLKKSDKLYQIKNMPFQKFTVYNTTEKQVILKEPNNLFDKINLGSKETKTDVEIYNYTKIKPVAITTEGIILTVDIQLNKLIIKF